MSGFRTRPARGGVALMLVVIAVAAATIVALGFAIAQSTSVPLARNIDASGRARMIAESGMEMAIAYVLGSEDGWRTQQTNGLWVGEHPYAGGNFTIYGEDGEDKDGDGVVEGDADLDSHPLDLLTLTSIGTYQGARQRVRAVILPTKRLLIVVPDPNNLTDEDSIRLALLKDWGWSTRVLRANATEEEFDAAAADCHVAYFPAHVAIADSIGTKLSSLGFPIVTERKELAKQLMMSQFESVEYDGSSVKILELTRTYMDEFGNPVTVSISHYITDAFPPGDLTICKEPAKLLRLNGNVATGTEFLGVKVDETYLGALCVMELGALNRSKKPVPTRRVVLPWGGPSFSIQSLNSKGLEILRRSLDWSGGAWTGLMPGISACRSISIRHVGIVDSYDSRLGPYGGENVKAEATIAVNSTLADSILLDGGTVNGAAYVPPNADLVEVIRLANGGAATGGYFNLSATVPVPNVNEPTDMGVCIGDVTYSTGVIEIAGNLHVNRLTVTGDALVKIDGLVSILCQDDVLIQQDGRIMLKDAAALTMYTKRRVTVENQAEVNVNTGDASRLNWVVLHDGITLKDGAKLCASVQGYGATIDVHDTSQFYGTFVGRRAEVLNTAAWHVDTAISGTVVTIGGAIDLGKVIGKRYKWVPVQ